MGLGESTRSGPCCCCCGARLHRRPCAGRLRALALARIDFWSARSGFVMESGRTLGQQRGLAINVSSVIIAEREGWLRRWGPAVWPSARIAMYRRPLCAAHKTEGRRECRSPAGRSARYRSSSGSRAKPIGLLLAAGRRLCSLSGSQWASLCTRAAALGVAGGV